VGSTTTTYTYDFEDRLTKVEEGAATLGEYRYDGSGNRYAKIVGAQTLTYTLDLASELTEVVAESDGTTYLYGADLLAMDRSGTTSWYLPDGIGSTRKVTDTNGSIIAGYEYEAFGKVRSSTGTLSNDVRFTGERTDQEAGLQFLRARHYDPEVGRFLQADKWPYDELLSQDLNRYAYVRNDPVNAVDPSGRFGWIALAWAAITVVSVVSSIVSFVERPSLETGGELALSVTPLGVVSKLKRVTSAVATAAKYVGAGLRVLRSGRIGAAAVGSLRRSWDAARQTANHLTERIRTFIRNHTPQGARANSKPDPKGFGDEWSSLSSQARRSWARPDEFADHYQRHAPGLGARSPEEYVNKAQELLRRSERGVLQRKIDDNGVTRVRDPINNLFGSYNLDGTIRTFLRMPGGEKGLRYWMKQPGKPLDGP